MPVSQAWNMFEKIRLKGFILVILLSFDPRHLPALRSWVVCHTDDLSGSCPLGRDMVPVWG
jgi:hypothetical protein